MLWQFIVNLRARFIEWPNHSRWLIGAACFDGHHSRKIAETFKQFLSICRSSRPRRNLKSLDATQEWISTIGRVIHLIVLKMIAAVRKSAWRLQGTSYIRTCNFTWEWNGGGFLVLKWFFDGLPLLACVIIWFLLKVHLSECLHFSRYWCSLCRVPLLCLAFCKKCFRVLRQTFKFCLN